MGEFTGEPEEILEVEEQQELGGERKWPDPDAEDNNHQQQYRRKFRNPEEVAAGLDGSPLVPQDFAGGTDVEQAEQEMGELYALLFDRPIEGLKPEWQRTWELTPKRNENGTVQVERVTYGPLLWSLRDIRDDLHDENVCVRRGVSAGKPLEPWQVQEWKLRAGIKTFVGYFFDERPDLLDAYIAKRKESGERDIPPDEILQRFVDGVAKLLRGQDNGAHKDQ